MVLWQVQPPYWGNPTHYWDLSHLFQNFHALNELYFVGCIALYVNGEKIFAQFSVNKLRAPPVHQNLN
jgi:hypothetical protein